MNRTYFPARATNTPNHTSPDVLARHQPVSKHASINYCRALVTKWPNSDKNGLIGSMLSLPCGSVSNLMDNDVN